MYSLAELHQSVEASLNDGEQGGCFNSLRIMSLLWLLVTDCEKRGCYTHEENKQRKEHTPH
ncbi:hypothetical protein ACVFYI_15550, partial [Klebsiella michiganensis]